MGHMKRVLVLVVILVMGILAWVAITRGVRYVIRAVTADAEPHYSMMSGSSDMSIVDIRYKERVYTARYENGKRVFEILEDERFGRSCKPRVVVGEAFILDYRCDEKGRTERNPAGMFKSIDNLIPQIVDDFNMFRPMADAYYAETTAKAKVAEAR